MWYDRRDPAVPCPIEYCYVILGERFSLAPWVVEQAPADRLQFYMGLLSKEGEYKTDLAGMEPDEPMTWEDEE